MKGSTKMRIKVNMKDFKEKWVWNTDTFRFGHKIEVTKGDFFTLDSRVYIKLLTDFEINFSATKEK
jgi:hypothetical protein